MNENSKIDNEAEEFCCSPEWGEKISAHIDNELGAAEALKVEEHIAICPKCREFAKKLRRLKGVTDKMRLADLPDVRWRRYWMGIYNRIERGVGWVFLSIGFIVLLIAGGYYIFNDFFADPEVPWIIKTGVGAFGVGVIILLISVIREAYFRFRTDRYKEVDI